MSKWDKDMHCTKEGLQTNKVAVDKKLHELSSIKDNTNFKSKSKEPNDGTFIENDSDNSFSNKGTVRYGEETDVDDI